MISLPVPLTESAAALIGRVWREVRHEHHFADRALERLFREERPTDGAARGTIATALYDMLRNARLLETAAGEQFADILAARCVYRNVRLPLFLRENSGQLAGLLRQAAAVRAVQLSVPDWLDDMGERELGAAWEATAAALNEPPQTVVRANLTVISRERLIAALAAPGFAPQPLSWNDCGIIVNSTAGLFSTPEFRRGCYEMQDAASQMTGLFCGVRPGMRVIDGCAGAGGKTLHLADLMQNRGKIIALDVRETALDELRRRAARARAAVIETRHISTTKVIKRLAGSADVVLLDAPCSGTGVLRRNPDAKWRLTPADVEEFRRKQAEILARYSTVVAPGGYLVYAVCSIFPSEGERQTAEFLAAHGGEFRLEAERRYSPAEGFDGFYMARMARR